MKKNEPKYFQEIIESLKELHKEYPQEPMSIHLGLATQDYSHVEDVPSDKELAYLLKKYIGEKTLDHISPFTDTFDSEEEEDY